MLLRMRGLARAIARMFNPRVSPPGGGSRKFLHPQAIPITSAAGMCLAPTLCAPSRRSLRCTLDRRLPR